MWCIFPEFEYIKLFCYGCKYIYIFLFFFCNLCALAFSDVLLEWWEAGDVLKSGFLQGKKIKTVCFYVSALGRCKISGKRERNQRSDWGTQHPSAQRSAVLWEKWESGSNSDVIGLGSWVSGVIWRKGFKDGSFATWEWCKIWPCSSLCLRRSRWNPTHPPFPSAAASGCAPRRWERSSSASSVLPACRTPHLHFGDSICPCVVLAVGCARHLTLFLGYRELFHTVRGQLLACCDKQACLTSSPRADCVCEVTLLSCSHPVDFSKNEAVAA